VLQAEWSQVRFSVVSREFFFDKILSGRTMTLRSTKLLADMSTINP